MKKSLKQILVILPTLVKDVGIAEGKLDNQQYSRRVYVRTLFAAIEGVTYAMKQALFAIGRSSQKLEIRELFVLKESAFDLNNKGEIQERPKYFRIPENLQFTVSCIERVLGSYIDIGIGTQDWTNFIRIVKLRNDVTHPKNLSDINISDENLEHIRSVKLWFERIVTEMMEALRKWGQSQKRQ